MSLKFKPYTCDSMGMVYVLPTLIVSRGPVQFRDRRQIFDTAFHWITFGFGLCIEWGRVDPSDLNKPEGEG